MRRCSRWRQSPHTTRVVAAIVGWIGFAAIGQSGDPPIEPEEIQVLSAALADRKLDAGVRWLLITQRTATFRCGPSPKFETLNVSGCSGMRLKDQSPQQVLSHLRGAFKVDDHLLADLESKSERSTRITEPLSIPLKYFAWGDESGPVPRDLGNPQLSVKMSRVGFNQKRTEAVAYIAWLYAPPDRTFFGEYVHLKRGPTGWAVAKRESWWRSNTK